MNLPRLALQFSSEEQCYEYLERLRWPDGVRCPTCGADRVAKMRSHSARQRVRRIFQCLERTCLRQFSATSGTIFHDTHLPLQKWFLAISLITAAKKGVSAMQLQRHLGVGYRTAWYLSHRIREAMVDGPFKLRGTVEMDETFIGGRRRGAGERGRGTSKQVVVGMRQRGGDLKLMHAPDVKSKTLRKLAQENISPQVSRIMTDDYPSYPRALSGRFFYRKHFTINHRKGEYVRGDIYTQSIESAFGLFKRGLIGSFHQVSVKHLSRYLNEFTYRFNRRKSPALFQETVAGLTQGKPLTLARLIAPAVSA